MAEVRGKGIARLYQTGGANLLAFRLGRIFTQINSEEARVRHNDMVADVLDIINSEVPKSGLSRAENSMLMFIARLIMERKLRRSKRKNKFLLALGEWVLKKGQMKGQ